jgi:DNA-directed RNA polymerase specialized sigma subunit
MTQKADDSPGIVSDLTVYEYPGELLSASEEADLIRLAKQGDTTAEDRIAKAFQPLVGRIVSECYGITREEAIGVGNLGLAKALYAYNACGKLRFSSYAEPVIRGTILDSLKGKTAADRALFAHPNATVDELIDLAGYSTASPVKAANARRKVEEAIAKRTAAIAEPVSYDTTEPSFDDDEPRKQQFVAVSKGYDLFERWHKRRHRNISSVIQLAVRLSETSAMRELKRKGRRTFAQELCGRDR